MDTVDMISQAISSLRVGRGTVRQFRQSGSWGIRYSGLSGSGFHVVLRGTGWLVTADAPPVALRPGDVVLITSGADHGLSHTPCALRELPQVTLSLDQPPAGPADFEFLCGAYRLDRGQVHPYLAVMPDPLVVSPDHDRFPALRSIVGLLDDHASQAQPGTRVTRAALLDLMLVHVLRQWAEDESAKGRPAISDPAIAAVLRTIHDKPQTQWTVARLSDMAGMSRGAFTRRFTAVAGKPPMTYLRAWRLSCAARSLRETDASLAVIARQIGYSTEFAFAGAFRREYGVSPGRFRHADGVPEPQVPPEWKSPRRDGALSAGRRSSGEAVGDR
ncbi:AraC family transcriptional regulator [Streptomyces aurantiacus]|uniref:AraC family transcriptional regulator n=1 Tax=Streptomyces aurantiacus TaxID=47760 RepID=UPI001FE1CBE0|nr:AraC family transcriptional regulator [Streptomyces aurantiacus]